MRIKEVIEAIYMLKKGKATGQDNITAEMLQNMGRRQDFKRLRSRNSYAII